MLTTRMLGDFTQSAVVTVREVDDAWVDAELWETLRP
jgi:hypothetical protein